MSSAELAQAFDEVGDTREEAVGILDLEGDRVACFDHALRHVAGLTADGEVDGVSPGWDLDERVSQGLVPVAGPAADDERVLVYDPLDQVANLGLVGLEFLVGVAHGVVADVTVDLDNGAPGLGERPHAGDLGGAAYNGWLNAHLLEGLLEQPVEVRRDDDAHVALLDTPGPTVTALIDWRPSTSPVPVNGPDT